MSRRSARSGFTLMESLVAVAIAAMTGAALLYAVSGSLTTSEALSERAIAQGIAGMVLDEISIAKYAEDVSSLDQWPLGPHTSEGPLRSTFDDIDDFNGYEMKPPVDAWGIPLGTGNGAGGARDSDLVVREDLLSDWRVTIDVIYVDDDNPAVALGPGITSNTRVVEVNVYIDRSAGATLVATARRVFANIHQNL
ncbi:MAG: type II secretion system GspH family protein [Pirellulales bacterium]|nr:type II secretion system GspH family protein [Pirellulales bacterium]